MQMSLSMSPLMVKVMRKLPAIMATQPICRLRRWQQKREPKRLLLNHISARFLSKDISQLKKDAATIFENVHVVKDLEEVEI